MDALLDLYHKHMGHAPEKIEEIPCAVSTRRYFRLSTSDSSLIGTFSPDVRETRAFVGFAGNFRKKKIQVPEVLAVSEDELYYLQTDLGNVRMHEKVVARDNSLLDAPLKQLYKKALKELVKLQITGYEGIDFSISVPRPAFDQQAIMWDLNHFKYYFLKPMGIAFDENLLEQSFVSFAESLSQLETNSFMFRDFQTRNIMLFKNEVYFIDFQGGRKGHLAYDLASLLFESKAGLLESDREELIEYYISEVACYRDFDSEKFRKDFFKLALIRQLQVLGTYGLRGLVEKKVVFIQSIPNGLKNLAYLLDKLQAEFPDAFFRSLLKDLTEYAGSFQDLPDKFEGLTLTITSFSYRKPLPDDISGNGGGFVYDCRYLNNPGLHNEYKDKTGLDEEVQHFLETESEVNDFISSIKGQLDAVISSYQKRNYRHLMLSFGCTGGRHRSVFTAHTIANWCRKKSGVRVIEIHREIGQKM